MRALRTLLLVMMYVLSVGWVVAVIKLGALAHPYLLTLWAAYPLIIFSTVWGATWATSLAAICHVQKGDGVTIGDIMKSICVGPQLVCFAIFAVVLGGPMIWVINKHAQWFPGGQKKEVPSNHWSKRVVFRCGP